MMDPRQVACLLPFFFFFFFFFGKYLSPGINKTSQSTAAFD